MKKIIIFLEYQLNYFDVSNIFTLNIVLNVCELKPEVHKNMWDKFKF